MCMIGVGMGELVCTVYGRLWQACVSISRIAAVCRGNYLLTLALVSAAFYSVICGGTLSHSNTYNISQPYILMHWVTEVRNKVKI